MNEENVSRRTFLKTATLTAIAAAATGGGAALVRQAAQPSAAASLTTTVPVWSQPISSAVQPAPSDLLSRLAATQADNIRLQAALDAVQRELTALRQSNNQAGEQSEALTLELASANERLSVLSGLLALYEQLDDVDVAGMVTEGFSAVSGSLTQYMAQLPTLQEGLQLGQQALANLEEQIPLVENGRNWLAAQIDKVDGYLAAIQTLLETAVDTVGPFLQMLNQWFQDVLRWLPFGMGDRAGQIAQAITDLLVETPHTVNGLTSNIAQPLDGWLSRQDGETLLHRNLIKPIREQVIVRTGETITQAEQIQTTYQTELVEKVETAVAGQKLIRDLITQYRQQYQL